MPANIRRILKESREAAAALHFPPFIGPERASTPLNATPYLAHVDDLRKGIFLSNRAPFVAELLAVLDQLVNFNAVPVAALLGGSAIGPKPDPGDLDCVVFYEQAASREVDAIGADALRRAAKGRGLDMRLVPMDGDPLLLLKTMSYFSMLYSKEEGDLKIIRGLVLIDCRTDQNLFETSS
jgi:hypothetical protein